MNIDVERGSASTQKHLEVIRLDISELTTPLPEQVKARWGPYKQRQLTHSDVTLDQIQAKLAAADEKRKETLRWVMTRAQSHSIPSGTSDGGEQRGKRLQAKLAAAEAKRQARLANRSAAAQGAAPHSFLQRRAVMRVWLRRQASSRKLQRMWRAFADRQTTRQLAEGFIKTGITSFPVEQPSKADTAVQAAQADASADPPASTPSVSPTKGGQPSGPAIAWVGVNTHVTDGADLPPQEQSQDAFEKFAKAIQSPATLKSAKALLKRLEAKLIAKGGSVDLTPLMTRLFPKTAKAGGHLERYPARVFLCAYMVLSHPQVVFNTQGELEDMLAAAGKTMIAAFETLLEQLAEPMQVADRVDSSASNASSKGGAQGTGQLLEAFDRAWGAYLQRFVAWKFADAAALESELIKVAIEMETSVLSKTGGDMSPDTERSEDLQAVIQQVRHDHALLKERVGRLGGPKATARLEAGLAAARAAASNATTPMTSPRNSPHSTPARSHSSPGTPPRANSTSPEAALNSPAGSNSPGRGAVETVDPNEAMAWELLYNLKWQLPTEELEAAWKDATGETAVMKEAQASPEDNMAPSAISAHVQRRVKRIAEQAFWDAVQASLAQSSGDDTQQKVTGQLAGLLAHLGQELLAVLPEQAGAAREQLAAELAEDRLQEALTAHQGSSVNGIDTSHLLSVLEHTAQLLKDMGAPAREAAAVAAQAAIRADLGAALQAGDTTALAAAVVKAIRVLMAQLKMLKLDAANFRLKMLAHTLKAGAGISYAQGKFGTAFGISQESSLEELSGRLTHSRAWLALVQGQVPQLSQQLQPVVDFAADQSRVQAAAAAAAPSAVPAQLRSGLRASPSGVPPPAPVDGTEPESAAQLLHPVAPDSWRGLVRLGLVHLVAGEIPVERTALAETLRLDAQRLHSAQNEVQQLVVLAACMLLLQQSVAGQQPSDRHMPDVGDVKRRLVSILADPSMRLPDLAAELTRLAGSESDGQSQAAMEAALNRMLLRSSGAFKALSTGISNAVQMQLLAGPSSVQSDASLQQACHSALARCGAASLKAEVAQLSVKLGQTAALSEAVHANIYQTLLSDLL